MNGKSRLIMCFLSNGFFPIADIKYLYDIFVLYDIIAESTNMSSLQ